MAEVLGIKRCWFHNAKYPHYDIPKRRISEIQAKCDIVDPRDLLNIIKNTLNEDKTNQVEISPLE